MNQLEEELPHKDLQGVNIVKSKYLKFDDLKPETKITENYIALKRYQLKLAFFHYKRKKARWLTLYNKIDKIVEKPFKEYEESYTKRKIEDTDQNFSLEEMVLRPTKSSTKLLIFYRILSGLSILLCLLILVTEATIIYDFKYTLPYYVNLLDNLSYSQWKRTNQKQL